jgi:hypothetical protein
MGLFVFLGKVIGKLIRFIRAVLPYAARIAWEALKLAILSLIATFSNWPRTAQLLANRWTKDYMATGILPHIFEQHVWWTFYLVAWTSLILGWIIASFLTVWILRMVF